jgi:hypothetical protein
MRCVFIRPLLENVWRAPAANAKREKKILQSKKTASLPHLTQYLLAPSCWYIFIWLAAEAAAAASSRSECGGTGGNRSEQTSQPASQRVERREAHGRTPEPEPDTAANQTIRE